MIANNESVEKHMISLSFKNSNVLPTDTVASLKLTIAHIIGKIKQLLKGN